MVQNVRYLNGLPSHVTLPFEYLTPILSSIQVFGIQMVTVHYSFPEMKKQYNFVKSDETTSNELSQFPFFLIPKVLQTQLTQQSNKRLFRCINKNLICLHSKCTNFLGHKCLLDVLFISLKSMDLRSADRIDLDLAVSTTLQQDLFKTAHHC